MMLCLGRLKDFKVALLTRKEVLEKVRNSVVMDKTRAESIKQIDDIVSGINVALTTGAIATRKEFTKILQNTLREVEEFIEYVEDPANFEKHEYITYVLNFNKFIDTYRGLQLVGSGAKALNKSQNELINMLMSQLDRFSRLKNQSRTHY